MSLVYITYHDENITNIETNWSFKGIKAKKYAPKVRERIRGERELDTVIQEDGKKILTSSFKSAHKSMGYAEVPPNLPCEYLRKNQGVKWQRKKDHVCPKPPVPMQEVPRLAALKKTNLERKHKCNFIRKNVKIVTHAKAKMCPPKYIDRHSGTPRNLLNSGLLPQHVCAQNFAKVPCYLRVRKKLLQKASQRCVKQKEEMIHQCIATSTGLRQLTLQEIQTILAGLKSNFAEVYKTYQCLSINTDTLPKRLQKSKIEKELRQLEHDIFLMESNPVIFVSEL